MHVRELVELGALIAANGRSFVHDSDLLTRRHLEQYWLASRCRHDRWFQAMLAYERAAPIERLEQWPFVQGVIEEVLASELLTRTWAAVAVSFDQLQETNEFEPIVRSVLVGHLEARNRVLHILVRGQECSVGQWTQLNRLRRQTERWTDRLLGHLAVDSEVSEFAFDAERAHEFAADLRDQVPVAAGDPTWELTFASLRATYHKSLSVPSPHAELNQRIAASILGCFRSDLFDLYGTFNEHWMLRLEHVANETQRLVDDLLQIEYAARPVYLPQTGKTQPHR